MGSNDKSSKERRSSFFRRFFNWPLMVVFGVMLAVIVYVNGIITAKISDPEYKKKVFGEKTSKQIFKELPLYLVIGLSGGTNDESLSVSYMDSEPEEGWTHEYKTAKLVLRRIDPGTFLMGSPENELGHYDDETQHKVAISQPFYIGVFEVTQRQYRMIEGMDSPGLKFKGDTKPVDHISFIDIRGWECLGDSESKSDEIDDSSFLGGLRSKLRMNFDLPTEAQWEYACRAGTTTALSNGRNLTDRKHDDGLDGLGRYAFNGGCAEGSVQNGHVPVGSYLPNAWGLYDMHGNVSEWCFDRYKADLGSDAVCDPKGPEKGKFRVLRGGSWDSPASSCRSASRDLYYPDYDFSSYGFRVVLNP